MRIVPGRYNDQIGRFILQHFVGIGYTRLEAELLSNIARRQAGGRRDRGEGDIICLEFRQQHSAGIVAGTDHTDPNFCGFVRRLSPQINLFRNFFYRIVLQDNAKIWLFCFARDELVSFLATLDWESV